MAIKDLENRVAKLERITCTEMPTSRWLEDHKEVAEDPDVLFVHWKNGAAEPTVYKMCLADAE